MEEPRPHLTIKETIKDSNPFEWGKEIKKGNKKVYQKKHWDSFITYLNR